MRENLSGIISDIDRSPVDEIVLDHGTGAKLSHELVSYVAAILGDVYVGKMEDSAVLPISGRQIAVTTDSFVVAPTIFGNGDIGKIAVCGTVNDISVSGATPVYLTLAMIIEVGFPLSDLKTIMESIRESSLEANIKIVAGDTKVVNKGEADRIFLNTTGIGIFNRSPLYSENIMPHDKIIVTGFIGNHSIHLLSLREGLGFEKRIVSDCAPLNNVIDKLLCSPAGDSIHCIRDVTRGGLGAVLQEFAKVSSRTLHFYESALPIQPAVRMASDMLGVNPLHLANEGCLCLFVAPDCTEDVMKELKTQQYTRNAVVIGEVTEKKEIRVVMTKEDGEKVIVDELVGAELPRLC